MEVSMLGDEAVETAVQPRQLNVTHHVKGSNVYIECYIPNFSFSDKRGEKVNGEGYLNLYIDGKKQMKFIQLLLSLKDWTKEPIRFI